MNSKHLDGKEDIKYELWGREARKCNFFLTLCLNQYNYHCKCIYSNKLAYLKNTGTRNQKHTTDSQRQKEETENRKGKHQTTKGKKK